MLDRNADAKERAFLLSHDTDPFNKWEAGRALAKDVLIRMISDEEAATEDYIDALGRMLADDSLDPAFRALCLRLPSEDDLAQTLHDAGRTPDPERIAAERMALAKIIARQLQKTADREL